MLAHAADKPSPETVDQAHKNSRIGDAFERGAPKFPKAAGDPVFVGE